MNFTISPKFGMYWSIAVAVTGVFAAGIFPHFIPSDVGKDISETAGFLLAVSASIQAVLHGVSAPQPGPLASGAAVDRALTK